MQRASGRYDGRGDRETPPQVLIGDRGGNGAMMPVVGFRDAGIRVVTQAIELSPTDPSPSSVSPESSR